jgi:hypothetical protein
MDSTGDVDMRQFGQPDFIMFSNDQRGPKVLPRNTFP